MSSPFARLCSCVNRVAFQLEEWKDGDAPTPVQASRITHPKVLWLTTVLRTLRSIDGPPYPPLQLQRSRLVRQLERAGPDNANIRERLIGWAGRADRFEILGGRDSPLHQLGLDRHAADDLVDWLNGFEEAICSLLKVPENEMDGRVAEALKMSLKEYDEASEDEIERRAEAHGIPILIVDG